MNRHFLLPVVVLTLLPWLAIARADDLAEVRDLYASAAYEEALVVLRRMPDAESTILAAQYKALCLLALGRNTEADQALETIVTRDPLYVLDGTSVSPRLVDLFLTVRKRVLPLVVRGLYTEAKTTFDGQQYERAAAEFKKLIAVSTDKLLDDESSVKDVRQLAEGFLKLAEAEVDRAAKAALAAARPLPAPVVASIPEPPVARAPQVYTSADSEIVAPVDIVRPLPPWSPTNPLLRNAIFRGVLEIVINEQGNVEFAKMTTPLSPLYDADLLQAASMWRFKPATKDGKPVKYRKALEIVLKPRG